MKLDSKYEYDREIWSYEHGGVNRGVDNKSKNTFNFKDYDPYRYYDSKNEYVEWFYSKENDFGF